VDIIPALPHAIEFSPLIVIAASTAEIIISTLAALYPFNNTEIDRRFTPRTIRTHPHDLPIPRLDAADIGLAFAIIFFGSRAGLATLSTAGPMLMRS
jgi:hypothetical protein